MVVFRAAASGRLIALGRLARLGSSNRQSHAICNPIDASSLVQAAGLMVLDGDLHGVLHSGVLSRVTMIVSFAEAHPF